MFIVTTNYLYDFFVGAYSTEEDAREGMYEFVRNECLTIIEHKDDRTYIAEDFLGEYVFHIVKNVKLNKTYKVSFGA